MKKVLKIVELILLILIGVTAAALFAVLKITAYRNTHYTENAKPGGKIEKEYTAMGPMKVSSVEYDAEGEAFQKFEIWYPSDMEEGPGIFPAVIMVNGTGVKASAYQEVFRHLALWGFIAAGNEDKYRDGNGEPGSSNRHRQVRRAHSGCL